MPNWAVFDDKAWAKGHTSFPNLVLSLPLRTGPKLLYISLLRRAYQNPSTNFPQAALMHDVSASDRAIRNWLRELASLGMISITRTAGETNVIRFHRLSDVADLETQTPECRAAPPEPDAGVPPECRAGVKIKKCITKEDTKNSNFPSPTETPPECPRCRSPKTSPSIEAAIQAWHDAYKARYSECPTFSEKTVHGTLGRLLNGGCKPPDEVLQVAVALAESVNPWVCERRNRLQLLTLDNYDEFKAAVKGAYRHGQAVEFGREKVDTPPKHTIVDGDSLLRRYDERRAKHRGSDVGTDTAAGPAG